MTGFQLLEALTKMDKEALRSDIFAGLNDEDRIVDAYVTSDGFVSLLTEYQRDLDAEEEQKEKERMEASWDEYFRCHEEDERRDELIQEEFRRMRR